MLSRLRRRVGASAAPVPARAASGGSTPPRSGAATKVAAFALVVGGTLGFSAISHDTASGLETTITCAVVAKAFDREGPDGSTPLPA